jgi:glycosyltransferase involved in cell wall biosynthesis
VTIDCFGAVRLSPLLEFVNAPRKDVNKTKPLTPKKIFITIPWFVPAFRAGGPVQSVANLVKEFQEGIEYFVFTSDTDLNGAELGEVEINQWVRFNGHTQVWYAGPEKISDTLVKQAESIKPDLIFIIGLFSWHFNIVPMLFCKGPRKILSTRGMLHPGALSQKKWKKKIYLKLFSLLEYQYKVDFHATDEEEADYIRNNWPPLVPAGPGHSGGSPAEGKESPLTLSKMGNTFVAGNFPNKIGLLPLPPKVSGKLILISIGIISPMKNILLVLQALEKVSSEIQYDLYGPVKDEAYWDLCKQQIKLLPENIQVAYHKEIDPVRVKEVLSQSHIFILPSKSENFGHAIYEALSAGRAVITSMNTPWNDLRVSKAGMNVSVDYTIELTEAIEFFVGMDEEALSEWQQGAFEYVEKAVDVEKIREEYRRMFLG